MGTLAIRLFGKLHIQQGRQVLDNLLTGKIEELFVYLMVHRNQFHHREMLAGLLWDKSTTTQSLKYLRQALWKLHTALDTINGVEAGSILLVQPEWIGLNPNANLWLDVAVFEQAFTHVLGMPSRELTPNNVHMLQEAVQYYRGDLLEGWYQDWCLYERERLQNLYLDMLDKLMAFCETHQEYESGIIYGNYVLKYDRARERTHRRLMRLHYQAGDRTAALRQYECCASALAEELGVEPATSTNTLYEQVCADHLAPSSLTTTKTAPAPTAMLSEIVNHLQQLRTILANTHRQIEEDIQTIEQVLDKHT